MVEPNQYRHIIWARQYIFFVVVFTPLVKVVDIQKSAFQSFTIVYPLITVNKTSMNGQMDVKAKKIFYFNPIVHEIQ